MLTRLIDPLLEKKKVPKIEQQKNVKLRPLFINLKLKKTFFNSNPLTVCDNICFVKTSLDEKSHFVQ